jgi:hypothetical protein
MKTRWNAVGAAVVIVLAGCETGKRATTAPATQPRMVVTDPILPKPVEPLPADSGVDPTFAEMKVKQLVADLAEANSRAAEAEAKARAAEEQAAKKAAASPPPPPREEKPAPAPPPAPVFVMPPPTDEVSLKVMKRAAADPRDVSAQLDSALLSYLKEEKTPDAVKMAALPAEDREMISAVMDALVNLRAGVRADPNAPYQERVRPLGEMADRLRTRGDLSLPALKLTSSVSSFGVYEPIPAALSMRAETAAVVYVEVANFMSRLNERGGYETRLTSTLSLYNSAGRAVWSSKPATVNDLCRNIRKDFFVPTVVRIPPMPVGKYKLKATVTDVNSNQVAERVLELESR